MEGSIDAIWNCLTNTKIKINRLSDVYDILPMTVSERLIEELDFKNNKFVTVSGQLRSYNKNVGEKNKLILTVFVREIKPKEEENKDPNSIFLDGYICKRPVYRKTPLGREITDLLSERHYYIYCLIEW